MVKEKKGRKPVSKESEQNIFAKAIAWVKNHPYWSAAIGVGIILLFVLIGRSITARRDSVGEFQTAVVERGDLIAIVGATGVVEANQSVELNWETTGRVASVNGSVNDEVETGEVLAELAANSLPQSVILAQADLVEAQKALEDVVNSNTDSAIAYTDLLEAENDLREAEDERDQWNYNEANMGRIYAARQEFLDAEEVYKDTQVEYAKAANLEENDPDRIAAEEKLAEDKLARDKALRTLNYILGKNYDQEVAEDFADYDVALAQLQ